MAAVGAPIIINQEGLQEDNIRHFPTPVSIAAKAMGLWPRIEYSQRTQPFCAEWVAGMFMVFKPKCFEAIGGFNECYFLYYEDVEICARLSLHGYDILACPSIAVVHDAQRESHRRLRYMRWHLQSMLRFFLSKTYRQVIAKRT